MRAPNVHPTSVVSPEVTLGSNVTIGPLCVVHDGVELGDDSVVGSHVVLGAPEAAYFEDPATYTAPSCRIGPGAVIRSHTVVYADARIGPGFECGHHVTIREGSRLGASVRVGTRSDLQGDLVIGDYVRVHSNVFIAQRTTIEAFAWLLPNVMLANDPHPPSDTCTIGPTIRRFAVVSAGATIFPGVEVGEGAVVGACALVREDVPPATVVVGVPSRVVGRAEDVRCAAGQLDTVYPWWTHFRRGYPAGALPDPETTAP
jgi:acetyltransferase-like isoleucine patch superfamily enzyme